MRAGRLLVAAGLVVVLAGCGDGEAGPVAAPAATGSAAAAGPGSGTPAPGATSRAQPGSAPSADRDDDPPTPEEDAEPSDAPEPSDGPDAADGGEPTSPEPAAAGEFVRVVRAQLPEVAADRGDDEIQALAQDICGDLASGVPADDLLAQVQALGTLDASAVDAATARELVKLAIDTDCLDQAGRVDEFRVAG